MAESDVATEYNMDLLGNLVSGQGGLKVNASTSPVTHAVNATNEITKREKEGKKGGKGDITRFSPFATSAPVKAAFTPTRPRSSSTLDIHPCQGFDDFRAHDATARNPLVPRFVGSADASISSGELLVQGQARGPSKRRLYSDWPTPAIG